MNLQKIAKTLSPKNFAWILFILSCSFFLLLLLKNPFSERNLIPNLEPYPDSIHYISPALSFTRGKGLFIEREGRTIKPTVPFFYSLVLVPLFLANDDARFFYFTNIILAFCGLILFYVFLVRVTKNRFISLFILFLYLTNYFVYWYPNLPMAENLTLTLFMFGLFLFSGKPTMKNSALAAILAVGFYATKYANFTLSAVFGFFYLLKILIEGQGFKKIYRPTYFIGFSILFFLIFFLAEYLMRGTGIFLKIQYLLEPLFAGQTNRVVDGYENMSWFSYIYFPKNFETYLKALTGEPMRFLWDFTPLLPKYIAAASLAGLVLALIVPGKRFLSSLLICFILLPVIFLSTFYTADARYVYHLIPTMLTGAALFLSFVHKIFDTKKLKVLFYVLLALLFVFYFATNYPRLKYQIALNLKHTETPWNYLSVKTFNEFFINNSGEDRPILITALPPYYIDFLSNGKYQLLPLSTEQEFTNNSEFAWGPEDYSNFINIYSKYITEGREVFVTNAALGNTPYLYRDFNLIKDNFDINLVKVGCLDTCNIYKLNLKSNEKYP